ncbi:MAG: ChbG/HpnK family deacetylase, partial [Burkholderiales bacterium]|nr:ChbG/HpnK family deacetylase [Burkholderiales bacterium]
MTRTLALCADDYGLAPAIDHGILGLLAAGRLSALSCLVNGAAWPAAARPL